MDDTKKELFVNELAKDKPISNGKWLTGCNDPLIDIKVAKRKDAVTKKKLVMMDTKARTFTKEEEHEMLYKTNCLTYFFNERHIYRHTLPTDTLKSRNVDKKDECCCCRNIYLFS